MPYGSASRIIGLQCIFSPSLEHEKIFHLPLICLTKATFLVYTNKEITTNYTLVSTSVKVLSNIQSLVFYGLPT